MNVSTLMRSSCPDGVARTRQDNINAFNHASKNSLLTVMPVRVFKLSACVTQTEVMSVTKPSAAESCVREIAYQQPPALIELLTVCPTLSSPQNES